MKDNECKILLVDGENQLHKSYVVNRKILFEKMAFFEKGFTFGEQQREECIFEIELDDIKDIFIYDMLFFYLSNNYLQRYLFKLNTYGKELSVLLQFADYYFYDDIIYYISSVLTYILPEYIDKDKNRHHVDLVQKTLKFFLENPILIPNLFENKLLYLAAASCDYDTTFFLLNDPRVDSIHNINRVLLVASKYCGEIVELLLKNTSVEPSNRNNTSLVWAVRYNNILAVKALLKDSRVVSTGVERAKKEAQRLNMDEIGELLKDY